MEKGIIVIKRKNIAICSNMNEPREYQCKSDMERQILYHFHAGSKKLTQMNLSTNQKQTTDIENKLMVTKGEAGREG